MTKPIKKTHSAQFKFQVAVAALKGDRTIAEICQEYRVAASQIYKWKNALVERGAYLFEDKRQGNKPHQELDQLHATIGRLKVENDFLCKVLGR